MSKCIKCEYCNNALYAGIKCKNCGRVTEQAAIKRDLTPEQPAQQEPVADRENAIIRFALHQFMSNAYSHMNAAAQDKDNRHYTAGAVEKFTKDAKDAEALLSRLQFKAPQPAQQALDKMAENARELGLDYEPAPMSQPNRAIAYSAASKLRELGYEWVADAWKQPAQQEKEGFASPGGGYVPAIPRPIPLDWKLVPRKATPEMLRAMDECAQEGYDERLYEGMASSVYMAAWDASPVLGTLPPSEKERSMMDIIVGNLVREGINKHRARELAEHFIKHTSPPARQRHISYACPQCHWSLEEQPAQRTWVGLTPEQRATIAEANNMLVDDDLFDAIEAELKEKNT